jgi:small conductance mechanosensitive channel
MEGIWNKVSDYIVTYGLNVVAAILIFIIGKWLASIISRIIEKLMTKANIEKTLSSFVKNIAYVGLMVFCGNSRP